MKHAKIGFICNAVLLFIITIVDFILGKYEYSFLLILVMFYIILAYVHDKGNTKFVTPKLLKMQLIFISITTLILGYTPFLDSKAESPTWLNIIFIIVITCSAFIVIYSSIKNIKKAREVSTNEYEKSIMKFVIIAVAAGCGLGLAYIINTVFNEI